MTYRLDKYISDGLSVSRRDAKKLLSQGAVKVNGATAKKSDIKVDNSKDIVTVNGKEISYEEFVYIMLNKPQGVVSAAEDKNDVTVVDLVRKDFPKRNLFPAGRLDKTSTGFVLITDDGNFAHNILSPKHHVDKKYFITVDAPITDEIVKAFKDGVTLADGKELDSAEIIPTQDRLSATVIVHQGVYHQIKRMLGVFDVGVNSLHRLAIGELELPDDLKEGEYKKISSQEIQTMIEQC